MNSVPLGEWFSAAEPSAFVKPAIPDYLVGDTDLISLGLSNKKSNNGPYNNVCHEMKKVENRCHKIWFSLTFQVLELWKHITLELGCVVIHSFYLGEVFIPKIIMLNQFCFFQDKEHIEYLYSHRYFNLCTLTEYKPLKDLLTTTAKCMDTPKPILL